MNLRKIFEKLNCHKIISMAKKLNRLSHAYLIYGDDEKLMREYLNFLAKDFLGDCNSCGQCHSCKMAEVKTHPDFLFYPREKEKINVAITEEIIARAYTKPVVGERKVIVICTMENMSEQAQNKLLKLLEEPPADTFFLFATTNLAYVLPTIKSRMTTLVAQNFTHEQVYEFISAENASEDMKILAASSSFGSVFKAIQNLSDDTILKVTDRAILILQCLKSSKDLAYVTTLFNDFDEMELLKQILTIFRDMLMIKSGNDQLISLKLKIERIKEMSENYEVSTLLEYIELTSNAISKKAFNINKSGLIDAFLLQLLEVKHNCQL